MSLIAGITAACDLCFFMTLLGMANLLIGSGGKLFALPFAMGLAAGLSHALGEKGCRRFLPALLLPPCALLCSSPVEYAIFVPAAAYACLFMMWNRRVFDYSFVFTRLRTGFLVLVFAVLFTVTLNGRDAWNSTLPYMTACVLLSVHLLRILRHDPETLRSRRFRIVNLSGLAAVCAAGLAFSTGLARRLYAAFIRAAWEGALRPAVRFIGNCVLWAVHAVSDLLSFLPAGSFGDGGGPDAIAFGSIDTGYELTGKEIAENLDSYPFVRAVIAVLFVAAAALALALVLHALSRRSAKSPSANASDVRERLDEDAREARHILSRAERRRDPALGVRYWYGRFLDAAQARGADIRPCDASLSAREKASACFADTEALDELRALYLPARYGAAPVSAQDAARAKAAYERIRKSAVLTENSRRGIIAKKGGESK